MEVKARRNVVPKRGEHDNFRNMKLYQRYVLPKLVHASCSLEPVMQYRTSIVPAASGRVLEVGFGSGLNLPYYDSARIEHLWALEPSEQMLNLARPSLEQAPFPVEVVQAPAEETPLQDASVDTVLVTFTLCTIPDLVTALDQIRRVLKKNGRILFCEHGAAPDENVRRWQNRLDPIWSRLAGGCHLNRCAPDILERNGFEITGLSTSYLPGWKLDNFIYQGSAVPSRSLRI